MFIQQINFFNFFIFANPIIVLGTLAFGVFETAVLPIIVRKWIIPGIKKRYVLMGGHDLTIKLTPLRIYECPESELIGYIAYQSLGLPQYARVIPGGLSEWLYAIGYDSKKAPFFEKSLCIFSLLTNLLFIATLGLVALLFYIVICLHYIAKIIVFFS